VLHLAKTNKQTNKQKNQKKKKTLHPEKLA
jgi:hypothetical protein